MLRPPTPTSLLSHRVVVGLDDGSKRLGLLSNTTVDGGGAGVDKLMAEPYSTLQHGCTRIC